jgi:BlaI family transcriptional regulator, penicillinase repressor
LVFPYFPSPVFYFRFFMARKSRHSVFDLPLLELQCMKALWALGEATVEDIRARLLPARPLAYTTVMTVMDRLARKGMVTRRKRGRAHVYSSVVAEAAVRERALERLVENFFGGSRDELRNYLAGAPQKDVKTPFPEPKPLPRPEARAKARPARRARARPAAAEKIDDALL